ncbi:type II secretion system minor pseudopilin GspH [Niveibacterium umoris]|uniref:General secretion pathway protein H n=1 Tax=Niveibacterium umoris TaxID=1193620 RepID=A0A840BPM6_9RHOO|nr:prepilin-type N-terminal cleavage/methylation domain-containing protein [Niveibacterium umoris]MBB4012387.1 general secretion pathway protein H [Niveibacterium umoris]
MARRGGTSGQYGFTLIEVMVVLVVLAITASAVTFSLEGMSRRDDEREADRLRLVLEAAGERAAVRGTPIAAEFLPGRYRFSTLDTEGNWRPVTEGDSLAERMLPEGFSWLGVKLRGRPTTVEPPLVFGAEMPDFEVRLQTPEGELAYRSRPGGEVVLERIVAVEAPK